MKELDHGRYSTYANKGCRCDLCVAAYRGYTAGRKSVGRNEKSDGPGWNATRAAAKLGIDLEDEIAKRAGVCDCCGKKVDRLVYDHDHKTGEFRGLLCDNCNTGIGKLGDDMAGLERAARYLFRNS